MGSVNGERLLPAKDTDVDIVAERVSPPDLAREFYDKMLLLRVFDERALIYHRQGRIGTWAISWGHEAIHVGAMAALQPEDWAFPSFRENKVGLLRGRSAVDVLAGCRGQPEGFYDPYEFRIAPICISVGSHIPHAVGFAWGQRLLGHSTAALAFFGDGATSEGEFHEAANFAGVLDAPVVLLCCNNQWAISTPVEKQTRARQLVDKAIGYGIRGVRVDGTDVMAVYRAIDAALKEARAGRPTFVECVIYRPKAHAFSDDPSAYRDDAEAQRLAGADCLERLESSLKLRTLLTDEIISNSRREFTAMMDAAIREAETLPFADARILFEHVFERRTPAMTADLALLLRSQRT